MSDKENMGCVPRDPLDLLHAGHMFQDDTFNPSESTHFEYTDNVGNPADLPTSDITHIDCADNVENPWYSPPHKGQLDFLEYDDHTCDPWTYNCGKSNNLSNKLTIHIQ